MAKDGLMFDDFAKCESPIEALLQLAMAAASRRDRLEWCDAVTEQALRRLGEQRPQGCILVGSQIAIASANARIDFLMVHRGIALAVECDGHQWHRERIDDISRDRYRDARLSAGHVRTMRLAGGAINRNPLAALEECLVSLGTLRLSRGVRPIDQKQKALAVMWPPMLDQLSSVARAVTPRSAGLVSTSEMSLVRAGVGEAAALRR